MAALRGLPFFLSLFSYLRLTAVPLRLRLWSGCRSRGDLTRATRDRYYGVFPIAVHPLNTPVFKLRNCVPLGLGVPAKKASYGF